MEQYGIEFVIQFIGGKAGIGIPEASIQGIGFVDTFAHFNDVTNGLLAMLSIGDVVDGDFFGSSFKFDDKLSGLCENGFMNLPLTLIEFIGYNN